MTRKRYVAGKIFGGNLVPTGEISNIGQDNSSKYDKLYKEHEILQAKLDKAMKDLASGKDTGKLPESNKNDIQTRELFNYPCFGFFFIFVFLLLDSAIYQIYDLCLYILQ